MALGIPALLFFREVFQHLQNIPTMDDYDIILDFLNQYVVAAPAERIRMIFDQYSEHRLIPSKLLYIAYYYLTGTVNFRILGILGDLQLIPVGLIGVYFIRKAHESWFWPSAAWMLVVFDLNTYENACMTMNAVGNYGVVCYFFCALYFYERKRYVWAVGFQALCIASNANGCMAAVVLLAGYSIHWFDPQRTAQDRKRWLICLLASVIFIACYFIDYEPVELPGALPFDAIHDLTYLIRMTGAPVSFALSFFYGLAIIGGFFFLFPRKAALWPPLRPLTVIAVFAGGTIVLAALFRAGYADAQFQTSRYLLYPQILLGVLGFMGWRRWCKIRKFSWKMLMIPLVFVAIYAGNYTFGEAGFRRTEARAQTRRYWHPEPAACATICAQSCTSEIYCIDENRDFTPQYRVVPRQYVRPYPALPRPSGQRQMSGPAK